MRNVRLRVRRVWGSKVFMSSGFSVKSWILLACPRLPLHSDKGLGFRVIRDWENS